MAIPKIIHYCWLSNDDWNEVQIKCFNSWKQLLPDYKFKLWDSNCEVKDVPFVKKMMRQKNWAFASDYIRMFALYKDGGIYLDLDVEVLKDFDDLLHHECFIGREDEKSLGCHTIGASRGNIFIKENLDYYDDSIRLKFSQPPAVTRIVTKIAIKRGLIANDSKIQYLLDGTVIFPSAFFTPLHYSKRLENQTKGYISTDSICIHYWQHSWSWLDSKNILEYIRKQPWLFMNWNDWKRFVMNVINALK